MTFDREEGDGGTDETAGKLSLLDWRPSFIQSRIDWHVLAHMGFSHRRSVLKTTI